MAWEGRALSSRKTQGQGWTGKELKVQNRKGYLLLKLRWDPASALGALCPALRYVLLHHVMGSLEGMQGAWSYVQGGMGALSDAIASSATARGASIFTEKV